MIPVTFPDPEALVVSYLREMLPARGITLPVATTVPRTTAGKPAPAYVRVLLVGGSATSIVIDESLIVIDVYGDIDADSTELSGAAAAIRSLMSTMPASVPEVRRVREVSRPIPRRHPESGAPSYSQSHTVITRGI